MEKIKLTLNRSSLFKGICAVVFILVAILCALCRWQIIMVSTQAQYMESGIVMAKTIMQALMVMCFTIGTMDLISLFVRFQNRTLNRIVMVLFGCLSACILIFTIRMIFSCLVLIINLRVDFGLPL